MATKTDMTVAETILKQLGGVGALVAMIGMHSAIADVAAVMFQWKAKGLGKRNRARIVLAPSDTYTVTFYKGKGINIEEVSVHADVQASELKAMFERETGLYLTVPTVVGL